jgi:SAM-dependent methyltransferase
MHDSWARHYDFVYDECFGPAFWRLTKDTLALIGDVQPAPARVLDLGAGTGRVTVPLSLLGYDVTAVEHSPAMAAVLAERAAAQGARVDLHRRDLRGFVPQPSGAGSGAAFDLALATFTVLNYLVADEDLAALARVVTAHLRTGGHFVFDLAGRRLFAPAVFESERLHREIDVRELAPSLFRHRDTACGTVNGERFSYDEVFTFRYWRDDEVLARLAAAGLVLEREVTDRLRASGSRWFVLRREQVRDPGPQPLG